MFDGFDEERGHEHQPDVPPWITADLARDATDAVGEAQPAYGEPLVEVIARSGLRAWLEGAVLAGYVPEFEGIELALRAFYPA